MGRRRSFSPGRSIEIDIRLGVLAIRVKSPHAVLDALGVLLKGNHFGLHFPLQVLIKNREVIVLLQLLLDEGPDELSIYRRVLFRLVEMLLVLDGFHSLRVHFFDVLDRRVKQVLGVGHFRPLSRWPRRLLLGQALAALLRLQLHMSQGLLVLPNVDGAGRVLLVIVHLRSVARVRHLFLRPLESNGVHHIVFVH